MDQTEIINIVNQCRKGDSSSFRLIVEEYQYMIYQLAFRMLCNEDEAKDIVQETFIRAWQNLSKYRSEIRMSTWLYTIATNGCIDRLRHKRNENTDTDMQEQLKYFASNENIEQHLINSEQAQLVLALTSQLTPKQKAVFTLHYLEELDTVEIQKITGLSAEKIKSNLYLARKSIRQKLELLDHE